MPLDVIGAGFGRTGTLSLKQALEHLGVGRCYHMTEVMGRSSPAPHPLLWAAAARREAIDWEALFAGYAATVDWPGAFFWRELYGCYPEARVILSRRDPDRWYDSVMKTIWPVSQSAHESSAPEMQPFIDMIQGVIWQGTFDGRIEERAHAISVYERHNAEVEASIPPERLLVYEPGEGWDRLCAFLDRPIPDLAFPHVNASDEFGKTVERHMNPRSAGG